MKKHFILILVLSTFIMTMQSAKILAENAAHKSETRWHENTTVRYVTQLVEDNCGNTTRGVYDMESSAMNTTSQNSLIHGMHASGSFISRYEHPNVFGDWYLRARLNAEWADDEPPYENAGDIKGKKGGMAEIEGSQADADWWAQHDPVDTIQLTDTLVRAKAFMPFRKVWRRTKCFSYFRSNPDDIFWIPLVN